VKDWGVAEDQSIDPETAKQIDTTPNHGLPQVHKLTIDSQFGDYSSSVSVLFLCFSHGTAS
jgi:hypothetical protein